MPVKFTFSNPLMRTWLLIHQSHNLMTRSENTIFAKMGLTTRKHSVLLAIKNLKSPVTVTDVSHWLDRNSNGISMLVDRMVNDGLISRMRDMPDHRAVRLVITRKGENCFKDANRLTRQFFQDIFSEVSEEDLRKTSNILEKVRGRALDFLRPDHAKEKLEVLSEQEYSREPEDIDEA